MWSSSFWKTDRQQSGQYLWTCPTLLVWTGGRIQPMIPPSSSAGGSTLTNSIQWDSSWPELVKGSDRNYLLGFLRDRFAIPRSTFASHHLFRRGPTVWLLSKDERLVNLISLQVESVGLPLLRWKKTHLKPTTAALQLFGAHAHKNIVSLEREQLKKLVEEKEIKGQFGISPGYVIIVTENVIIGCGLYVPGRLISQFPRHLFTVQTWKYLLGAKETQELRT